MTRTHNDPRANGRLGGLARAQALGANGMAELGRRGGNASRNRFGVKHLRELARRGGLRTHLEHGRAHFVRAGKLSGESRRAEA